jgi:hypothetical protein
MISRNHHHEITLDQANVIRYLENVGWKTEKFSGKLKRLYSPSLLEGEGDVELFFSATSNEQKIKEVQAALITISQFYDKSLADVVREIASLGYDIIASRVPTEYVYNETVDLKIASEYVDRMRDFLSYSATAEISQELSFKRTLKEAIEYADSCRFGHTFRGSFGFVIESPVGLNPQPKLPKIDTGTLPLARRIVQRIVGGLSRLDIAIANNDPVALGDAAGGLNANMCDGLADIIEEMEVSKLAMSFHLSTEWEAPTDTARDRDFVIESKHVDFLRSAAQGMRTVETPKPTQIIGRIKRLETSGNPADIFEDLSKRELEVVWTNDDNKPIFVKMVVKSDEYLDAVEAHKQGKYVSAAGLLSRKGRGWQLLNVSEFKVL